MTELNRDVFACPRTFVTARDFSPINCDVSSNAPFNFLPVSVSSRTLFYLKKKKNNLIIKTKKLTEQHVI
jgi:hypothetical protein